MRNAVIREIVPSKTIQVTSQTIKYNIHEQKYIGNMGTGFSGTPNNKITQKFSKNSHRYDMLKSQHKNFREIILFELLNEMTSRRKRFSFQMLKLLYMFPDDSFSENVSVNSYDRLFFQDEHVHTIVKIYQTKQLQAKIWAFLNLKTLHKIKKLQAFTNKIENVQKKLIIRRQRETFGTIQQYSIRIKPERNIRIQPVHTFTHNHEKFRTQSFQTNKTEKIESTKSTNEATRISGNESSLAVRRIYLEETDPRIKIVYPLTTTTYSPTKVITSQDTRQKQKIKQVVSTTNILKSSKSEQNFNIKENSRFVQTNRYVTRQNDATRIIYPSRIQESTHIQSNTNISHNNNNTARKIQPVTIRATQPQAYYSRPYMLQSQETRYHRNQTPLVHTVTGDCTINIHNGTNNLDDRASYTTSESSRHKSLSQSKYKSRNYSPHSHHNQNHNRNSCQCHHCCSSHHQPIMIVQGTCSCQQYYNMRCNPWTCGNNHINPQQTIPNLYYIEERIQYLKYLQQMNRGMQQSKSYSKR